MLGLCSLRTMVSPSAYHAISSPCRISRELPHTHRQNHHRGHSALPESKVQPNYVHCDGADEANLSGRKRTVAVTLSLADGTSPAPGSSNASGESSAAKRDRGVAVVYVGESD